MGAVSDTAPTLFFRVGGMPFFERLVDAFYAGVATDDVLLPLYPEQPDLTGARHRLTLFLAQYWGGPDDVLRRAWPSPPSDAPLPVPRRARRSAIAGCTTWGPRSPRSCDDPAVSDELMTYFVNTAEHMRNDTGLPITSANYGTGR